MAKKINWEIFYYESYPLLMICERLVSDCGLKSKVEINHLYSIEQ